MLTQLQSLRKRVKKLFLETDILSLNREKSSELNDTKVQNWLAKVLKGQKNFPGLIYGCLQHSLIGSNYLQF